MKKSIDVCVNSVLERQRGYENDIDYFRDFLGEEKFNDERVLGGIRTIDICESIIHRINLSDGGWTAKNTARKYMNAIVTLFREFIDEGGLVNGDFQNEYNMEANKAESYYNRCNKIIDDSSLKETNSSVPISDDEFVLITEACNDLFKQSLTTKSEKNKINRMLKALYLKMMLLTGATNRTLVGLPFDAYNENHHTLSIEGFVLPVPQPFAEQLFPQPFAEQLSIYVYETEAFRYDKLFCKHPSTQQPRKSQTQSVGDINSFLANIIGHGKTTAIVKYVIMQYIRHHTKDIYIRRITGAKDDIMISCYEALLGKAEDWSNNIANALPQVF